MRRAPLAFAVPPERKKNISDSETLHENPGETPLRTSGIRDGCEISKQMQRKMGGSTAGHAMHMMHT